MSSNSTGGDGLNTGAAAPRLARVVLNARALMEERNPISERALHLLSRVGIFSRTAAEMLERDESCAQEVAGLLHELANVGHEAFGAWTNDKSRDTDFASANDVVIRIFDGGILHVPRLDLSASDFNEAWLQRLVHQNPTVLPLYQAEPEAKSLHPVCRELPLSLPGGSTVSLDNFLLTPEGRPILVECKLWRNPEARRKVVAQALEYASAVFAMNYDQLEKAAGHARRAAGEPEASLFELAGQPEAGEAAFCDAVSRNLASGRALVCVVGDGIREEALALGALLQGDASKRFTFMFVELAVYGAAGDMLVVPSIPAKTQLIDRGVMRLEQRGRGSEIVWAPSAVGSDTEPVGTLNEDEFYEELDTRQIGLGQLMRAMLGEMKLLTIDPDMQKTLNLKFTSKDGRQLNIGSISKTGVVDTSPASWFGLRNLGAIYSGKLAALINGEVAQTNGSVYVRKGGKLPRLWQLLPKHRDGWIAAAKDYIIAANEAE